jgi:hypothetical protein
MQRTMLVTRAGLALKSGVQSSPASGV